MSVTLTLTSGSAQVGNFTIYCQSADPGNEIDINVTSQSLAAGWCTDISCSFYVVKANTNDCNTQIVVYPGGNPPAPTPGPVTPTPTPVVLPTLTNGWRVTLGNTFSGDIVGYHRATLFGCPTSSLGMGTEVSPTTTQINLPGTDCYYSTIFGSNTLKGYGVQGIGNVNSYILTQLSLDRTSGVSYIAIANANGVGNPGALSLSGTIQGTNNTSGTWNASVEALVTYVDNNGTGTAITPESQGSLNISGLTLTDGVTYNLTT